MIVLRFLEDVPSQRPDRPFQMGDLVTFTHLEPDVVAWIEQGYAVILWTTTDWSALETPDPPKGETR